MIRRLYVEKKEEFAVEAKKLYSEFVNNLKINSIDRVRVINRYDVDNIDEDTYAIARDTIFSEPAVDRVFNEGISIPDGSVFFTVEYLPGQYDQRADSAEQCIKIIAPDSDPIVKCAKLYVISGNITENEKEKIIKFCVNSVDSRIAEDEKPDSLAVNIEEIEAESEIVGFVDMSGENLKAYIEENGLAMSFDDIKMVQDYFIEEDRNPTLTEIKVIDTYWSDHCRHTTFNTILEDVEFESGAYADVVKKAFERYKDIRVDKSKPVTLMDIGTVATKYFKANDMIEGLDESEEINACSIKVTAKIDGEDENWLVMFKNETHNHPTEIEPFGGAATCLGGAIRDPLSGRSYVYQAMRVTGAGNPHTPIESTLEGKLPQKKITTEAARGYSSYGNQIGIATGQVSEIYDDGYVAKRMEVGAVIGAAPAKNVVRLKPEAGDVIILVGGRTGRDGCGGATGSSKKHQASSIETASAEVQKGNPPVERNLQRLFRRNEVSTLIKRCNDFGAGGVSVAIGELADSIDVNLDLIPKKYDGLSGTELAISESQERMAVVVDKNDAVKFIEYANEENLEATQVARVTDSGRFRMYFKGKEILSLRRDFLDTNGARVKAKVLVKDRTPSDGRSEYTDIIIGKYGKFGELNCCSQKGLIETFDSTIGQGSVLMPLGGKYQMTPTTGMCAKLPVGTRETDTATAMTWGYDSDISKAMPYYGGMYSVIDAVSKAVAMGVDYRDIKLSLQEYFPSLGDNPEKWGLPFEALLGALDAEIGLGIGAIGGKDSMSGTFQDIEVPPTVIAFTCATVNANHVISPEIKRDSSRIYMLYSGDLDIRNFNFDIFKDNMYWINKQIKDRKILSCSNVGKGGIWGTLIKMTLGNHIGFTGSNDVGIMLDIPIPGAFIFESMYDMIAECSGSDIAKNIICLGSATREDEIKLSQRTISIEKADEIWRHGLENIFPTKLENECSDVAIQPGYYRRSKRKSSAGITPIFKKPAIVIPVFQGTNCEADSRAAFEKHGGNVKQVMLRNLTPAALQDSIRELVSSIAESQMIFIPGGFSGGDEPDGSAKFITSIFRNPMVRLEVEKLMNERDGLMLGICNGFQALIKLGLLPYGEIRDMDEDSPTLTYNLIGRHVSGMVRTRVASVKSPWLRGVEVGDIHTIPVSHGEGRFIATEDTLQDLINNGQVATQYVDLSDTATMKTEFNPNGSMMAIEGITSPDGRILGKMGHSERIGNNLYKNIPGNMNQNIFKSGIEFFK